MPFVNFLKSILTVFKPVRMYYPNNNQQVKLKNQLSSCKSVNFYITTIK